jgi:hypothetical protein
MEYNMFCLYYWFVICLLSNKCDNKSKNTMCWLLQIDYLHVPLFSQFLLMQIEWIIIVCFACIIGL